MSPGLRLCEAEIAAIQHQTRAAATPAHNPVLHITALWRARHNFGRPPKYSRARICEPIQQGNS